MIREKIKMVMNGSLEIAKHTLFFIDEKWSGLSTKEIYNKLPQLLQLTLVPVVSAYLNGDANTAVVDWSTPSENKLTEQPILMILPEKLTKGPNFLAQAIEQWGESDHTILGEDNSPRTILLYSSNNGASDTRQIIARIPEACDGRIYLPRRYQTLTTVGCAMMVLGGIDTAIYQFVRNEAQAAFKMFGKETYLLYQKRIDTEEERAREQRYAIAGEVPPQINIPNADVLSIASKQPQSMGALSR